MSVPFDLDTLAAGSGPGLLDRGIPLPDSPPDSPPGEERGPSIGAAAAVELAPQPPEDHGPESDPLLDALDPTPILDRVAARRPEIVVRDELVPVTDEAIGALRAYGGLYVRARMVVQVVQADGLEDPATRLLRPAGAPVIVTVSEAALRHVLDCAANWVKPAGRKRKTTIAALPPGWVAEQILARTEWPFPYLAGVVATPVLRPDGSVLSTPGYDHITGLFYEPVGDFPEVRPDPTHTDAETALALLLRPVAEFPFTDPCGQAAYVAAVLSLVGRYVIDGCVPGFAISSPTPGTGKTLLAKLIGTIGTGRPGAVMSQPREDDELRKRILAIALAGAPLVQLDNMSGVLGSDVLAAALTATLWSDRMLGVSTMVDVPLNTVWIVTGNNLSFKKTLGRRMVPIYLDAGIEHPEDRSGFAIEDLIGYVEHARPALVAAALTILRAFAFAGRPRHRHAPMGSFEAWDDWIRGACVWLGLADPAQTDDPLVGRGKLRAHLDEDREALGGLLAALDQAFGTSRFMAAEVADRITDDPALKLALEEAGATTKQGHITTRTIGYYFRNTESRVIDGLQLLSDRADGHSKVRLWRVVARDGRIAGNAGHAGDNPGPIARENQGGIDGIGSGTSPASPSSTAAEDVEGRYGV